MELSVNKLNITIAIKNSMVIKLNKRNNKNKKCDKEEPVNNAKRKAGITSETIQNKLHVR